MRSSLNILLSKKIILMVGYPGSGKSTLARKLMKLLQAEYLSSDVIREKHFHSLQYDTVGDDVVETFRQKAHEMLYQSALAYVAQGSRVVVDATHIETKKRLRAIYLLTQQLKKHDLCFVALCTQPAQIKKRFLQLNSSSVIGTETPLEAWQRVYAIFQVKKRKGLISWPTAQDGITIVDGGKLARNLD